MADPGLEYSTNYNLGKTLPNGYGPAPTGNAAQDVHNWAAFQKGKHDAASLAVKPGSSASYGGFSPDGYFSPLMFVEMFVMFLATLWEVVNYSIVILDDTIFAAPYVHHDLTDLLTFGIILAAGLSIGIILCVVYYNAIGLLGKRRLSLVFYAFSFLIYGYLSYRLSQSVAVTAICLALVGLDRKFLFQFLN